MRSRLSSRSRRTATPPPAEDPVYTAALAAFRRADFPACRAWLALARTEGSARVAATELLAARLARLEGDFDGWYAAAGLALEAALLPGERLGALALRALAARNAGKAREAAQLLAAVRLALQTAAPADGVYAGYLLALEAWLERDLPRSERLTRENLTRDPRDAESLALLGWIAVKRERFRIAGKHFADALAALQAAAGDDLRLRARLLHGLAVVASETSDLRLGRKVRRESGEMRWPEGLRIEHFNTLTCLRFLALLEGDVEGCWVASRTAVALAPSAPYQAIGETNAAVAARLIGDEAAAMLQFRRAWDLLRTERWSEADAEGRVALTNFACEGARAMPAEARKALMLYRSLRGKRNRANSLDEDRRITASETWAAARVAEVMGERDEAVRQYHASLEVWQQIGFVMRAGAVAKDLFELTRDPAYLEPLERLATLAPQSLWARAVREARGPLSRLRPAQLKVLARLLRGDSAQAIAADLGRSYHTVVNHTRTIFTAFAVHNRADLRRACSRAGVTTASLGAGR